MPGGRPPRPCTWCGRTTVSIRGICAGCQATANRQAPGPEHALTGGRWRPSRGGVLRWQAAPAPAELDRSA